MNTTEHPDSPPLTRKQIRELRNTGATPVVSPADSPLEPAVPVLAPLARAAAPVVIPEPPVADSAVDLGVSPLTRRQARQQERIRTASVPVITPEVVAAHAAATGAVPAPAAPHPAPLFATAGEPETATAALRNLFGPPAPAEEPAASVREPAPAVAPAVPAESVPVSTGDVFAGLFAAPVSRPASQPVPVAAANPDVEEAPVVASEPVPAPFADEEPEAVSVERPVVSPLFGAALFGGSAEASVSTADSDEPASFDQLISRPTSGGVAVANTLVLGSTGDAPIIAPVAATGEMIVTGTLNLPEGLGSTGFAAGSADGKEVDAVLVDGEIPAHSSPTPIAASAAVSTSKTAAEVIKPPAPEKGGKLMMSLAITAGVLALALVGVLILAFATGVF